MFGYGYKKDAIKWREHERKEKEKFLSVTAEGNYTITLNDGSEVSDKITRGNRIVDRGFLDCVWVRETAVSQIIKDHKGVFEEIGKNGDTIEGTYYPPHVITKITLGDISEIKDESK